MNKIMEDPAALVDREDAPLAKDVREPRPSLRRHARELLLDQVTDVRLRAVPGARAELRRHRVGAQPGGDAAGRPPRPELRELGVDPAAARAGAAQEGDEGVRERAADKLAAKVDLTDRTSVRRFIAAMALRALS